MTKKPFEDNRLARYLERRILELKLRKTQAEIAAQAGFIKPVRHAEVFRKKKFETTDKEWMECRLSPDPGEKVYIDFT